MIGVNRNGVDGNGLEYDESSSVFSPTGEKLEPFEILDEIQLFDLRLDAVTEYRKDFPVNNDRKDNIYYEFYNLI